MNNHLYVCIDLKSFYASVECVERKLNPLTTNLVVADTARTEKTICLAVSPSLKALGVASRPRLFEAIQQIKKINLLRKEKAPNHKFIKESTDDLELKTHNDYAVGYIAATPQMAKYIAYSTKIYDIYLKYVSAEDIHVYSIDEVFMDISKYLKANKTNCFEFAMKMIQDVLKQTGITATAGIGTNMFLAKVAMDIVAKKITPDENGVRMAYLDEQSFKEKLWAHEPITDFWRIGHGIANRLAKHNLYTMGDIARCSLGKSSDHYNEDLLYQEFGINAELIIDHAWGYEPTTIADVKAYKPENNSLSTGQVLHCPYNYSKTKLIVKEMIELLSLDLVEKKKVTDQLVLYIGYDIDNLNNPEVKENYQGEIVADYFNRLMPKGGHGSINIGRFTSSTKVLTEAIVKLYMQIANPSLMVRRVNIAANHIIDEDKIPVQDSFEQLSLFGTIEDIQKIKEEKINDNKEKQVQKAILEIKKKYGKNSVLKGMNLKEGATTKDRNSQIGGHKA